MTPFEVWAAQWNIPPAALSDLRNRLICDVPTPRELLAESEAAVQNRVRLEASRKGLFLWRNNVGVATAEDGSPVRYGLANDSSELNKVLKSSDLIGVRPVTITGEMVGSVIGRFVAREVKHPTWTYKGTAREVAQKRFIELVVAAGGDAAFTTGEGSL